MGKYYCNGKRDFCTEGDICETCGYYDGTGGEEHEEDEVILCKKCKKAIEKKDYIFCPYCGEKYEEEV